jgi:hypothetical protein
VATCIRKPTRDFNTAYVTMIRAARRQAAYTGCGTAPHRGWPIWEQRRRRIADGYGGTWYNGRRVTPRFQGFRFRAKQRRPWWSDPHEVPGFNR